VDAQQRPVLIASCLQKYRPLLWSKVRLGLSAWTRADCIACGFSWSWTEIRAVVPLEGTWSDPATGSGPFRCSKRKLQIQGRGIECIDQELRTGSCASANGTNWQVAARVAHREKIGHARHPFIHL